jgi:hypothetical protein
MRCNQKISTDTEINTGFSYSVKTSFLTAHIALRLFKRNYLHSNTASFLASRASSPVHIIAMSVGLDEKGIGFESRKGQEIFLFFTASGVGPVSGAHLEGSRAFHSVVIN